MELLARYLERTDRTVYALVRASSPQAARERLRGVLVTLFGDGTAHADRVTAVPGDIESDGLGLDPWSRVRLAEEVTDIVHAAARAGP
jgi:thioester reductase-like protein